MTAPPTEIAVKLRDAAYGKNRDSLIGAASAVDDAYQMFLVEPSEDHLKQLNGLWAAANRVLIKSAAEPQVA